MLIAAGNAPLSWNVFDVETAQSQALSGLKLFHPIGIRQPPGWVYMAGDIVSNLGYLSNTAGKRYQHATARWTQPVGRLGPGAVCVSFAEPSLYYVEPRKPNSHGEPEE